MLELGMSDGVDPGRRRKVQYHRILVILRLHMLNKYKMIENHSKTVKYSG